MSSRAPATVTNHNLTKKGIACPQVRSGRLPPSCRLEMFTQATTEITDLSWSQSQHISDVKKISPKANGSEAKTSSVISENLRFVHFDAA